jgi:uncharacterized protein YciI
MICAVIGILKQPPPPRPEGFQSAVNEHLSQRTPRLLCGGYLRGPENGEVGILGLVEADSLEQAQAFLDRSPFAAGDEFDHVHVAVFNVEVGRLG